MLKADNRCMIYAARPFGCRTHFCQPAGGIMERRTVVDLIHRLEQLDTELGGDGAHEIERALLSALNQWD
jgi:hypothetical protein